MQRVAIIGSSGAGKSTLAQALGQRTGLPVIHLDRLYWRPGWVEPPKDEWRAQQAETVCGERWIIDGNYGSTLDLRLSVADTVVFLDFPRRLCLWRVIKRRWMYAGKTRPDMGEGCREKIDWAFLRWVWDFPKRSRPRVVAKLDQVSPTVRVIRLCSPREVAAFLQHVPGTRDR